MMSSRRDGRPPLPSAGDPEPKALGLGFKDVAAMREAVEGVPASRSVLGTSVHGSKGRFLVSVRRHLSLGSRMLKRSSAATVPGGRKLIRHER